MYIHLETNEERKLDQFIDEQLIRTYLRKAIET